MPEGRTIEESVPLIRILIRQLEPARRRSRAIPLLHTVRPNVPSPGVPGTDRNSPELAGVPHAGRDEQERVLPFEVRWLDPARRSGRPPGQRRQSPSAHVPWEPRKPPWQPRGDLLQHFTKCVNKTQKQLHGSLAETIIYLSG